MLIDEFVTWSEKWALDMGFLRFSYFLDDRSDKKLIFSIAPYYDSTFGQSSHFKTITVTKKINPLIKYGFSFGSLYDAPYCTEMMCTKLNLLLLNKLLSERFGEVEILSVNRTLSLKTEDSYIDSFVFQILKPKSIITF